MNMTELQDALLTLRNASPEGAQMYSDLLSSSAGVIAVMVERFSSKLKLKTALESDAGQLLTNTLEKAKSIAPWFESCKDRAVLALAITQLRIK